MDWNRVTEYPFLNGGFQIYLYQLALGLSLRYWSCLGSIAIRIYIGPFKLWFSIPIRRTVDKEKGKRK